MISGPFTPGFMSIHVGKCLQIHRLLRFLLFSFQFPPLSASKVVLPVICRAVPQFCMSRSLKGTPADIQAHLRQWGSKDKFCS